jgi:GH15 family glucan-1,4-alpha-glucosidase
MSWNDYPQISDYGFIADCHSCALVSLHGSIDWACLPRFDSGSCFGRILDWHKGGFCQISPVRPYESSRRYIDGTLILETTFENDGGKALLIDCFTMKEGGEYDPHQQILRVVEGIEGEVEFKLDCAPRFDFGAIKPWIRTYKESHYIALGGNYGLLISGNFCLGMKHRHHLEGTCKVSKGNRYYLSITHRPPEVLDEELIEVPAISELSSRLDETVDWWRSWLKQCTYKGPYEEQVKRSAIVLKGLSNAPTGAIVAAATTSLPEAPGGSRNWDYRLTWIRDSCFAVRSLAEIGFMKEADGFRHKRGHSPDTDYWEFLTGMVETAATTWQKPDRGIWEMRLAPRHFVHSKVMCWAALDYGVMLAEELGLDAPVGRWKNVREEIRKAAEEKGYDAKRGIFVQAFDNDSLDSSLLLMPTVGFIDYQDPRMIRTTEAVQRELSVDGFLHRYPSGDDGMEEEEGAFLACSFWLVNCFAHQGRLDEAHEVFRKAIEIGNELHLFSEEYDVRNGTMLGNYPQGLTHLSLITAAVAISEMEKK